MTEQEDGATELDLVYEDIRRAKARIEALEAALEAMCLNMKNDGHAYRDCYIRARAALAPKGGK